MVVFPPITVRQPRPHDIVDDPVGDADRSRAIFQANRDQIEDPDLIFAGQVLRVPR